MTRTPLPFSAVSAVLVCCSMASAQADPAPQSVLDALAADAATLQALELPLSPSEPFAVDVAIGGVPVSLELSARDLRAPGFQLRVQGEGGETRVVEAPPIATVRGAVAGHRGSLVSGSLVDGQLTAVVQLDGDLSVIRPVGDLLVGAGPAVHVVYPMTTVRPPIGLCADPLPGAPSGASIAPGPADGGTLPKLVELAIDSDVEFFSVHGTVDAALADIEFVHGLVADIFMRDADVYHELTAVVIRTAEPDPYTSNDPSGALGEFATEWQTTHAGVPRDLAQFFTGKGWDGLFVGLAYQSGFCNIGSHYSAIRTLAAFGNPEFRSKLSAHELCHTWGAFHCNGQAGCDIMCSSIGACAGPGPGKFGGSAVAAIEAQKAGSPCLEDACGPFGYGLAFDNAGSLTGSGSGGIGTPVTFTYADPPTAPSVALLVIATALHPKPKDTPGLGVLLVDRNTILAFTPGVAFGTLGDTPSEAVFIPGNPALIGLTFLFQAAFFDGLMVTGLSNGVAVVICN